MHILYLIGYLHTWIICKAVCLGVSLCGVWRKGFEGANSPLSLYTQASLKPADRSHRIITVQSLSYISFKTFQYNSSHTPYDNSSIIFFSLGHWSYFIQNNIFSNYGNKPWRTITLIGTRKSLIGDPSRWTPMVIL